MDIKKSEIMDNAEIFLSMYRDVLYDGVQRSPRGFKTLEIMNYSITIDPRYPLTSFNARELNLSYAAAELWWYLRGNRYDLSICDYGSMWKSLIQEDGGLNSNYGQTIFNLDDQFGWVVEELIRDQDSRRAVMIIGDKSYLSEKVNDQRCCQFIQYCIRDNELHCYANFRSSDAIWGFTNDTFTLVEIMKYVYVQLAMFIPNLKLGTYTHNAISFHVYERHWSTLEKLVESGMDGFYLVDLVQPSIPEEFVWLGNNNDPYEVPVEYLYAARICEMVRNNK